MDFNFTCIECGFEGQLVGGKVCSTCADEIEDTVAKKERQAEELEYRGEWEEADKVYNEIRPLRNLLEEIGRG